MGVEFLTFTVTARGVIGKDCNEKISSPAQNETISHDGLCHSTQYDNEDYLQKER